MRRCRFCSLVVALAAAGCSAGSGSPAEPSTGARDVDRPSVEETSPEARPPEVRPQAAASAVTPGLVPGATTVLPVKPAAGPRATSPRFAWPLNGRVTSPFGPSSKRAHHAGIDIDGAVGDPIRAAADGEIARIADHPRYGLLVVVVHDGGFATWYGHATDLFVGKGDTVTRGQVIALVGETGNARGTHLHFEVRRNSRPVNPIPFLPASRSS